MMNDSFILLMYVTMYIHQTTTPPHHLGGKIRVTLHSIMSSHVFCKYRIPYWCPFIDTLVVGSVSLFCFVLFYDSRRSSEDTREG